MGHCHHSITSTIIQFNSERHHISVTFDYKQPNDLLKKKIKTMFFRNGGKITITKIGKINPSLKKFTIFLSLTNTLPYIYLEEP